MRQASCFLCPLISPHRKRDGRYLCVEVFSQEFEELHQGTFKNGENHKLGDVKTPLDCGDPEITHPEYPICIQFMIL
jgi:hypothetical protein